LVQSANDAAEILAENYPGGRPAFIQAMNTKASALDLRHTHFVNPTGLDETGHYSSAADLVRLAEVLVQDHELSRIVSTENAVLSVSDGGSSYVVSNVNQLLGKVPGVLGIKTGFTDGAGQALVTLVNRDNHPVLITVLGSQDRFTDSQTLIEWVYSNFTWPAGS
jgi:serine-type D-Ala-D-Ala carboxypeptidase (penicillin-binding protein 5/6)